MLKYYIFGPQLSDINECEINTAICGVGSCINTEGNFTCVCPDGHMLMPDKRCMGRKNYSYMYLYLHIANFVLSLICYTIQPTYTLSFTCRYSLQILHMAYTWMPRCLHVNAMWHVCRAHTIFYLSFTDAREGNCYLHIFGSGSTRPGEPRVTCENPLASNLTMKQCCCSVGRGWNALEDVNAFKPCTPCPRARSSQYLGWLISYHSSLHKTVGLLSVLEEILIP